MNTFHIILCVTLICPALQYVSGDDVDEDAEDAKKVDLTYCQREPHKFLHLSNFTKYRNVLIDPEASFHIEPNWVVYSRGSAVVQTANSDPGLAVNYDAFKGVDFEGSLFVDTDIDDDYIGFVFSFESSKAFYAVMWKKVKQTYWSSKPTPAVAEAGVQIKLVKSTNGPGPGLRNALWHSADTDNEVKVLWKDSTNLGWKSKTPYEWKLIHRPSIGLIKLIIYQSKETIVQATIFDSSIQGGRIGLLGFSQEMVVWTDMRYRCIETLPKAIHAELPADLQAKITAE